MESERSSVPYVCVTADTHAGASIGAYREYLDPDQRLAFDQWRGGYEHPSRKKSVGRKTKNWDSAERLRDLFGDGVVGEVIFPNTVPPFYRTSFHITPELVATPLDSIPQDSTCLAFLRARAARAARDRKRRH